MDEKTNKPRRPNLRFNEDEIQLSLKVMQQLEKPLELMYYLMERDYENPFVMILISANDVDIENVIRSEKRNTDLLFKIDEERNLLALICQETNVDGGYRFTERLLGTLLLHHASKLYCSEIEIRSTKYDIKEVIFKAIESYITAIKEEKEGEIIFRSLY